MSKWLCQLPWVFACASLMAWGVLALVGRAMSDDRGEDGDGAAGLAFVMVVFGLIGIGAWAVIAFAVN